MMIMRRVSFWAFNSAFLAFMYFGFVAGIDGFKNICYVIAAIHIFSAITIANKDAVRKMREKGSSKIPEISVVIDVVITSVFAFYSHEILAFFYLLAGICQYGIFKGDLHVVE